MQTYRFPFPPSLNNMYPNGKNGRRYISQRGKTFKAAVDLVAQDRKPKLLRGPVWVELLVHPPDRRKRDLDNLIKPVLDAMVSSGFIEDDEQVKRIEATMAECDPEKRGLVVVGLGNWNA